MTINAEQMVERYLEAEAAVLEGKSVTLNGRTMTLENLGDIRRGRLEWERRVQLQQRGGGPGFVRFL